MSLIATLCHPRNWTVFQGAHVDTVVLCCLYACYSRTGFAISFKQLIETYQKLGEVGLISREPSCPALDCVLILA